MLTSSRGFHDALFERAWYPRTRKNRATSASPFESIGQTPIPRVRVFPFYMALIANTRKTISFGRFIGPALIKDVSFTPGFGVDPSNWTLEIGTSSISVTENNVGLATAKPYSVLTELVDPFSALSLLAGDGIPGTTLGTAVRWHTIPLDFIVELPEFYAVLGSCNASGGVGNLVGHIRVIEGVNREALGFFL